MNERWINENKKFCATNNHTHRLLEVVVFLTQRYQGRRITHRALICSEHTYILRRMDGEASAGVSYRIAYRHMRAAQLTRTTAAGITQIGETMIFGVSTESLH